MNFFKSITCAFKGVLHCVKSERNMRIHTVIAVFVLAFSSFFSLSLEKYSILILTISSVFLAEMVNTCVEEILDLLSEEYNPIVKIAKDVAAGAVLLSSVCAVVVGFILFWNTKIFCEIYEFFVSNVSLLFVLIIAIAVACFYIKFGITKAGNFFVGIKFRKQRKLK